MMRFVLILSLFMPVVAHASSPIAEIICAPTGQLTKRLSSVGNERSATGIRSPEQIMELWTDSRGDWTMVVRYATGTSCIVAMGEAWEPRRDPA